jgi:hypothetical protein
MSFGLTIGTERAAALQVSLTLIALLNYLKHLLFFRNPFRMSLQNGDTAQTLVRYLFSPFMSNTLIEFSQILSWLNT